jgi:hypothetical protein
MGLDQADTLQAKSSSGIPPGARWTKIDRKLVNPEALQEAKERFEERLDCVIVLRVLTKEEIQKLADRTKELRGKRRSHYFTPPESSDPVLDDDLERHDAYNSSRYDHRTSYPTTTASPSPTEGGAPKHGGRPRHRLKRRAWTVDATQGFINTIRNTLIELSNSTDERYEEEREERRAQRRHERHADRHQRDEYDDNSEDEFKPRAPKMLEAPSSTMTGASASDHTVSDYVRDSRDRRGERERESHHMSGGLGSRRDDGYER